MIIINIPFVYFCRTLSFLKILSLVLQRSSVVKYIVVILFQPLGHSLSVGELPWHFH